MNMWNDVQSLSTVICRKDGAWKGCVEETDKKKKKRLDKVTRSGSNCIKTCTAL